MPEETEPHRPLRLLVVEDDRSQLRTLTDIMEAEGFAVIACANGAEALDQLGREAAQVAVVDLRLPDLTGTQLLVKLRERAPDIHIVIYTAYGSLESAKDAVNGGAFAYVEKAGDPDELVRHVHRAFQARLRRHAAELESAVAERTRKLTETNKALEQEITERKQAEHDLKKYQSMVESAHDAIFFKDVESRYVIANTKTLEAFGLSRDEVIGRNDYEIMPDREEAKKNIEDDQLVLRTHKPLEIVKEMTAVDGKRYWFQAVKVPQFDEKGNAIALVGIARDITDVKRTEQALRRSHEQLRALAARLQEVREEERASLARSIHDDLGHVLAALKMDLAGLSRIISRTAQVPRADLRERIGAMSDVLDNAVQFVRRTASQLRPPVLDDFGLEAALEWEVRQFVDRTGIACEFACSIQDMTMDREHSTNLFRICQELLTNVAQHASATEVKVILRNHESSLCLEVNDNGKGITDEQAFSSKSVGILGVRERARILGGDLSISGLPGKGTTATVRIPFEEGQEERDS